MSFIAGSINAAYHGACRNSFNDTMGALILNSHDFHHMLKVIRVSLQEMKDQVQPEQMFVFGALAGATKGLVCHLLERVDRSTVEIQKKYPFFFKLIALGAAFFAAYKATAYCAEEFGIPLVASHTVLAIEGIDLLHQLCFYSPKVIGEATPFTGRRLPLH